MTPYQVQIEMTNACNLDCIGCMRESDVRKQSFITKELFYKILDMIDCRISITPWINGEPTLHPLFHEFALEMNSRKQRYSLNSNAQIWKENIFQAITNQNSSCYQLIFSSDGIYDKTNNIIRRGSSLNKTIENINRFIDLKKSKKSKIDFGLKLVDKGQDYEEIEDFIYTWLSNKDIDFVSVARQMAPNMSPEIRHYPCKAFADKKGVLGIRYDGVILLCCYNEEAINNEKTYLGNILDYKTISEAFTSKKHNDIREKEKNGEFIYPCNVCSIAYTGDGLLGLTTFRNETKREKIPYIYWHSDSFQNFYSLKDTRGVSKLFERK